MLLLSTQRLAELCVNLSAGAGNCQALQVAVKCAVRLNPGTRYLFVHCVIIHGNSLPASAACCSSCGICQHCRSQMHVGTPFINVECGSTCMAGVEFSFVLHGV